MQVLCLFLTICWCFYVTIFCCFELCVERFLLGRCLIWKLRVVIRVFWQSGLIFVKMVFGFSSCTLWVRFMRRWRFYANHWFLHVINKGKARNNNHLKKSKLMSDSHSKNFNAILSVKPTYIRPHALRGLILGK